jgi:hypothetical protein
MEEQELLVATLPLRVTMRMVVMVGQGLPETSKQQAFQALVTEMLVPRVAQR